MANLTITVEEGVLREARLRALAQGKSVNAILAEYLRAYAGHQAAHKEAARALIELSLKATSGSGGRKWTRDELHAR